MTSQSQERLPRTARDYPAAISGVPLYLLQSNGYVMEKDRAISIQRVREISTCRRIRQTETFSTNMVRASSIRRRNRQPKPGSFFQLNFDVLFLVCAIIPPLFFSKSFVHS